MNSKEYAVLYALMNGTDAAPLPVLAQRVEANPADVAIVLDDLVAQHILRADVSYHASDLGEIDYSFHECDHAQEVYQRILDENPHLHVYEPS